MPNQSKEQREKLIQAIAEKQASIDLETKTQQEIAAKEEQHKKRLATYLGEEYLTQEELLDETQALVKSAIKKLNNERNS